MWRFVRPAGEPDGMMMWFDPSCEEPAIFRMEPSERRGVQELDEEDDQLCAGEKKRLDKQQFIQYPLGL